MKKLRHRELNERIVVEAPENGDSNCGFLTSDSRIFFFNHTWLPLKPQINWWHLASWKTKLF